MIFISPECFPCFLRQADLAARAHGASEAQRNGLAARISAMLSDLPPNGVPAEIATRLQAIVREELDTPDPFLAVKRRELDRFSETSRRAEEIVAASPDPLAAAVKVAVFGNIMDSGIIERDCIEKEFDGFAGPAGVAEVPQGLLERIRGAKRIGVLLDNAGEAAFDVPLLARLGADGRKLWIGAKGGPVIDDLTAEEARRIGLSMYGEIVSNGNQGVGTILDLCTPEFRDRIDSSDLILSKGQANFETLTGRAQNAVFLLRCKCPVVSRALGKPEGDIVILDGAATA
ncbi:MAG: DUF89 family protein [Deltaproteobacteria bacterium]|nr:DUF89 family protein [Deltaproteobacteria bacterium]